jgi:brefeldin A-resistance guanine nucleotide exchange factor 1
VPESLKNVVLVMHSAGMLIPPGDGVTRSTGQAELWDKANERISKFLGPEFMASVVPQSRKVAEAPPANLNQAAPVEREQQD